MRKSLYDFCLENGRERLLTQWDQEKNTPLTPHNATYGSKQKVWWRCEQGHEWQAAVYTRTSGDARCPFCAGKQVCSGENDLASQNPALAAQWHPTRNAPLTPDRVSVGSHRSVWWVCEQGHEWRAIVKSRSGGCGCPVCANRTLLRGVNDLASTHPQLAQQWHPTKNGRLTPGDFMAGTRRKVWWICEKGHEWCASIVSRADGAGCPVCTGRTVIPGENDLASSFPNLARQWHSEKNEPLTPQTVSPYSNRKVWWRCELGHEYPSVVATRTKNGTGCPYCAGKKVLAGFNDLATLEPEIAAQWHPALNGALTPEMVTKGSRQKVWWQCPAGHVWKAIVYSRAGPRKYGCPVCAGRVKPSRLERYAAMITGP